MKKFSDIRQRNLNESVLLYANYRSIPAEDSPNAPETEQTTVLSKIKAASDSETPQTFKLRDGTIVQVSENEAKEIVYTYEELNQDNQAIFENLLNESVETYSKIVDFCREYNN
jgi:hypothetical protein